MTYSNDRLRTKLRLAVQMKKIYPKVEISKKCTTIVHDLQIYHSVVNNIPKLEITPSRARELLFRELETLLFKNSDPNESNRREYSDGKEPGNLFSQLRAPHPGLEGTSRCRTAFRWQGKPNTGRFSIKISFFRAYRQLPNSFRAYGSSIFSRTAKPSRLYRKIGFERISSRRTERTPFEYPSVGASMASRQR